MRLDIRSEIPHRKTNFVGDSANEENQWMPYGNLGFIDRYINYEADIHMRIRSGNGQEFVAYFQREWDWMCLSEILESIRISDRRVDAALIRQLIRFGWKDGMAQVGVIDCQQKSMLVHDIEPVQLPERVIPSLVWIEPVDRFYRKLPHSFYSSWRRLCIEFGTVEYWEKCMSTWNPSTSLDHLVSQIVEGASEVVQRIAKDQGKIIGERGDLRAVVGYLSQIDIELGSDFVRIRVDESVKTGLQIVDVLLGPLVLS